MQFKSPIAPAHRFYNSFIGMVSVFAFDDYILTMKAPHEYPPPKTVSPI